MKSSKGTFSCDINGIDVYMFSKWIGVIYQSGKFKFTTDTERLAPSDLRELADFIEQIQKEKP